MIAKTSAAVADLTSVLVARRVGLWLVLLTPLCLLSCAGGIIFGGGLIMLEKWWTVIPGVVLVLGGLLSIVMINPLARMITKPSAERIIDNLIEMERTAASTCLALAAEPAYFNACIGLHGGAIAVNPKDRKVAMVMGQMQSGKCVTRDLVLDVGDIVDWQAVSATAIPTRAAHYVSSIDALDRLKDNVQGHAKMAAESGLQIRTKNLHFPRVMLNFDSETAKAWVLVLNKLAAGNLEAPCESTVYPFRQAA